MNIDKPDTLEISEELLSKLKIAILDGIRIKINASKKLIDIDKEVAAGIHVYSIEELGKLLLLKDLPKEGNHRVIKYNKEYTKHRVKFEVAANYLKKIGKTNCLKIGTGSFTRKSFTPDNYTMDNFTNTEARLGIFYMDLKFDINGDTTENFVAKCIKSIPYVDSKTLTKAIDCLEELINKKLDELL